MLERGVSGWVWVGKTVGVSVRGTALPSMGLPSSLSTALAAIKRQHLLYSALPGHIYNLRVTTI